MSDYDSVIAPWNDMKCHRVPVNGRPSMINRILKLLRLRKSDSEYQLWGTASANDWARAMLGGTTGSREEIASVLGSAMTSGKSARIGRAARRA